MPGLLRVVSMWISFPTPVVPTVADALGRVPSFNIV